MAALFWTELRCSCWNHFPSLGVTAPNAPNYYRDHFWLSPPTSAPFISSTAAISFPFLLLLPDVSVSVDERIYRVPSSALCQPQLCLLRLPRVTCLSGTQSPSRPGVCCSRPVSGLPSTRTLERLFTPGSNVPVQFHRHGSPSPQSQPAVITQVIFGVSTGYPVYSGTPQLKLHTHTRLNRLNCLSEPLSVFFYRQSTVTNNVVPSIPTNTALEKSPPLYFF